MQQNQQAQNSYQRWGGTPHSNHHNGYIATSGGGNGVDHNSAGGGGGGGSSHGTVRNCGGGGGGGLNVQSRGGGGGGGGGIFISGFNLEGGGGGGMEPNGQLDAGFSFRVGNNHYHGTSRCHPGHSTGIITLNVNGQVQHHQFPCPSIQSFSSPKNEMDEMINDMVDSFIKNENSTALENPNTQSSFNYINIMNGHSPGIDGWKFLANQWGHGIEHKGINGFVSSSGGGRVINHAVAGGGGGGGAIRAHMNAGGGGGANLSTQQHWWGGFGGGGGLYQSGHRIEGMSGGGLDYHGRVAAGGYLFIGTWWGRILVSGTLGLSLEEQNLSVQFVDNNGLNLKLQ